MICRIAESVNDNFLGFGPIAKIGSRPHYRACSCERDSAMSVAMMFIIRWGHMRSETDVSIAKHSNRQPAGTVLQVQRLVKFGMVLPAAPRQ